MADGIHTLMKYPDDKNILFLGTIKNDVLMVIVPTQSLSYFVAFITHVR